MSSLSRFSLFIGLAVAVSLGSVAIGADKPVKVAIYNADMDGGESFGEQAIMQCLSKSAKFAPRFITELSGEKLSKYKVLVLPLVKKFGRKAKSADWRWEILRYVHAGGRILLTSENTGIRGEVLDTLFPTIMEGQKTVWSQTIKPIPVYSINKGIEPFVPTYSRITELRRGSKGTVFLRDSRWCNVGIVGNFGEGKVAAVGFPFGVRLVRVRLPHLQGWKFALVEREAGLKDQEARLLLNIVEWLAGEERYKVPIVWIEARRLPPLPKRPSKVLDANDRSKENHLFAGAAAVDITPPDPVGKKRILRGLGRGVLKCKGVHDRIMLRALVLYNGKCKLAIVSMDRIETISRREAEKVRKALKAKIGLRGENLLINCTHTHSATWSGGINLVEKTIEAVCKANDRLRPARIGVGSKMIYGICANIRKRWHDDYIGLWQNQQPNPDGVMDNECGVVRVEDENRKLIAIVVNYTGTPSAAGRTPFISGDYAGIAMHILEKRFGCVALFTQGFQGNVFTSAFRINRDMKDAERLGKKLADEVASMVPHIDVKGHVKLSAARKFTPLPVRKGRYEAETQALIIGDCIFVLGEPEVYVEIGLRIKEQLSKKYSHVFCCGVGTGAGKYLSWRRGFGVEHRNPDTWQSPYTEDAEGSLVESIIELVRKAEAEKK
ncbi:MAG: hypothetical protein J7L99_03960 [Planctomycetes bacterium]|nr:hypothetical protein [Planctomycetota bacterium]